jgi:uracil-DNA glycosylase
VDAREQLRRYLEQRRDMGETELILDTLAVDEALKLIAGSGSAGSGSAGSGKREAGSEGREGREARTAGGSDEGDWRSALRAAGASPDAPHESVDANATESSDAVPASRFPPPAGGGQPPASREAPEGISVGTPTVELFGGSLASLDSLEAVAKAVATCTKCPLYSTATNPVPGEGNPHAKLMCVGEAPGATEDETGKPFVGAAGQLLTKILAAIDLPREQVFICNVLKHRPPGNRNPLPQEVTACSPYLIRQIELIRPKVILALGTFAAQTLLDTKTSIGKLRGQVHRYYGVPLVVTYHPAALLRNPGWKRPTWEDVQLARRILESPPASGGT